MKIIFLIVCVFLITMVTSVLFEWDFIGQNPVRYFLVLLLIFFELAIGFFYIKSEIKNL